MGNKNFDLIVVLGPTATGKTNLAANLAYKLSTEIISADSRQVYRGMDLGTGKDIDEYIVNETDIPYHLIDIKTAGYKYNVYEYQADFLNVYNNICKRGKIPLLCGGTGMYIESVLKGYKLINVPANENLRSELENYSLPELSEILSGIKNQHNTSDIDTKKRAIRAIEIALYYKNNSVADINYPIINPLIFGVLLERKLVKERITLRLKQRLRDGMIDEVQGLLNSGISPDNLIYYGLEYKYITQFLQKEFSYNKMVEKLNVAIHQFSKRQMTWFRKMERDGFKIHWVDGELPLEEKTNYCLNIINRI